MIFSTFISNASSVPPEFQYLCSPPRRSPQLTEGCMPWHLLFIVESLAAPRSTDAEAVAGLGASG